MWGWSEARRAWPTGASTARCYILRRRVGRLGGGSVRGDPETSSRGLSALVLSTCVLFASRGDSRPGAIARIVAGEDTVRVELRSEATGRGSPRSSRPAGRRIQRRPDRRCEFEQAVATIDELLRSEPALSRFRSCDCGPRDPLRRAHVVATGELTAAQKPTTRAILVDTVPTGRARCESLHAVQGDEARFETRSRAETGGRRAPATA